MGFKCIPQRERSAGSHSPFALQYRDIVPVKPGSQGTDTSVRERVALNPLVAGHTFRSGYYQIIIILLSLSPTTLIPNFAPGSIQFTTTSELAAISQLARQGSVFSSHRQGPLSLRLAAHHVSHNEVGGGRYGLGGRNALQIFGVEGDGILGGILEILPREVEHLITRDLEIRECDEMPR